MSWETQLPTGVSRYWQVPGLYLESWGPQLQPMGLSRPAPQDDCSETNSVGSVWLLTSTMWAGVGLWLLRLKLLSLAEISTWILSLFKAGSLRKSSAVQRGGSGSSNCWGNKRCRQIYQLLHFEHPAHPMHPDYRACTPQWSPSPGGALKPHSLAQQLILPGFWPILPVWNGDASWMRSQGTFS